MADASFTPGPWEYVPSTADHGPYVVSDFGLTICDAYVMSPPGLSVRNGGSSKPLHHLGEMADPNCQLIAAAPDLLIALQMAMPALEWCEKQWARSPQKGDGIDVMAVVRSALSKAEGRS